jgi:hypothetical protein
VPAAIHVLLVAQLTRWLDGGATNPADLVKKKRLEREPLLDSQLVQSAELRALRLGVIRSGGHLSCGRGDVETDVTRAGNARAPLRPDLMPQLGGANPVRFSAQAAFSKIEAFAVTQRV